LGISFIINLVGKLFRSARHICLFQEYLLIIAKKSDLTKGDTQ